MVDLPLFKNLWVLSSNNSSWATSTSGSETSQEVVGHVETLEVQVQMLLENQQQLLAKIKQLSLLRRCSNSLSLLMRVFTTWINLSPPATQSDLLANSVPEPAFPEFSFFPANPNNDLDFYSLWCCHIPITPLALLKMPTPFQPSTWTLIMGSVTFKLMLVPLGHPP